MAGERKKAKAKLLEAGEQIDKIVTLEQIPGIKVKLPFPGLKSTSRKIKRPPPQFLFCQRDIVTDISSAVRDLSYHTYILAGPGGGGKSCVLRALAVMALMLIRDKGAVVCLWSLGTARCGIAEDVRDAFLFAFCRQGDEVVDQICGIETWEDAVAFMKSEKKAGHAIMLIVDEVDSENIEAQTWVAEMSKEAFAVIKAVPPGAKEYRSQQSVTFYNLYKLLTKEERALIIAGTFLDVKEACCFARQMVIDDLVEFHPLSISVLSSYCNRKWGKLPALLPPRERRLSDIIWRDIVVTFKQNSMIRQIRESVREADIDKNEINSLFELTLKFPLYATKTDFCTPLIRKAYMEEAIARGLMSPKSWRLYIRNRLQNLLELNKIDIHWFCANYVSHWVAQGRVLKFADNVKLRNLPVVLAQGPDPEAPPTSDWEDGDGILMVLDTYFCSKDFVVMRKVEGIYEVYEGKISRDLRSDKLFMDESRIKSWLKENAEVRVWSFYLCPTVKRYSWHDAVFDKNTGVLSFKEFFEGIETVDADLLQELAAKRDVFGIM